MKKLIVFLLFLANVASADMFNIVKAATANEDIHRIQMGWKILEIIPCVLK
jgi:hypothetical protein